MAFFDFLTEEVAIDLGTANTLIIHNDKVVVDSPSIVALDRKTGKIIAVGQEANLMQGKTHENIKTVRPLKDGVIADFDASEQMISMFIKNIPSLKRRFFTPSLRMVICIPSGITEVEMRAVKESAERVNGKEVYLIHEPMAADSLKFTVLISFTFLFDSIKTVSKFLFPLTPTTSEKVWIFIFPSFSNSKAFFTESLCALKRSLL